MIPLPLARWSGPLARLLSVLALLTSTADSVLVILAGALLAIVPTVLLPGGAPAVTACLWAGSGVALYGTALDIRRRIDLHLRKAREAAERAEREARKAALLEERRQRRDARAQERAAWITAQTEALRAGAVHAAETVSHAAGSVARTVSGAASGVAGSVSDATSAARETVADAASTLVSRAGALVGRARKKRGESTEQDRSPPAPPAPGS